MASEVSKRGGSASERSGGEMKPSAAAIRRGEELDKFLAEVGALITFKHLCFYLEMRSSLAYRLTKCMCCKT